LATGGVAQLGERRLSAGANGAGGRAMSGKSPDQPFVRVPKPILARRDLTASAKLIYGSLVDRMGNNGRAWPGLRRIAADVGCNPKTALSAVKMLSDSGLIETLKSEGRSNSYRLKAVPKIGTAVFQKLERRCSKNWNITRPMN
jgi:DNA-binding MarR family transcriptional regulator